MNTYCCVGDNTPFAVLIILEGAVFTRARSSADRVLSPTRCKEAPESTMKRLLVSSGEVLALLVSVISPSFNLTHVRRRSVSRWYGEMSKSNGIVLLA